MKKTFKHIFMLALGLSSTYSFAQLSTREDDQSTYRIGTRPVKGNFSYQISAKVSDVAGAVEDVVEEEDENEGGPLRYKTSISFVNLKYYLANNLVLRGGMDLGKEKKLVEATGKNDYKYTRKKSDRYTVINFGLEKHFATTNFLDPYVGAEIYAGRLASTDNTTNGGDQVSTETTKKGSSMLYGAGAFFGIQGFVADLPLSIGFEWGFLGLGYLGNKYKVEEKQKVAGVTTTTNWIESAVEGKEFREDVNGGQAETLKAKQFDLSGLFRVNISYYFTK